MRPVLALTSAGIALVALVGCGPAAPVASPSPTPTATDQPTTTPSATTTPTPTTQPSSDPPSPPATATPPPASPGASGARSCGDEYVLTMISGAPTSWEGTAEEQLAQAQPERSFAPAEALASLDVECVVTYRTPIDGSPGVAVVSQAVVARSDVVFQELEGWANASGYTSRSGQTGFVEREAPLRADGTSTMKIFWAPLDGENPTIGNAAEIVRLSGAQPDAVLVWHADFTQQ